LIGLESSHKQNRPCFRSQLKKCFGACHGAEPAEHYNDRLTSAIERYQIQAWPYQNAIMIEEQNLDGQTALHIIDHWRYITKLEIPEDIFDLGYQVCNQHQPTSSQPQTRLQADDKFDLDIYFILVRFLMNEDNKKISNLKIWMLDPVQQ
jgi:DNA polymerase-3 subunit epsilon